MALLRLIPGKGGFAGFKLRKKTACSHNNLLNPLVTISVYGPLSLARFGFDRVWSGVMTAGVVQDRDVDIDLGHLWSALWKRKLRIALLATAFGGLAFFGTTLISPKYQAETRLLIESGETVFSQPASGAPNADAARTLVDREAITSQVEIIKSSDLLRQVALKLDLASRPEFDKAADLSAIDRMLIAVGAKASPFDIPPDLRVLESLREKLEVYVVENSRVVAMRASSKDPELAARIPNTIAEVYLELNREAKLTTNKGAAAFLQPEIADMRERVRRAEARVAEYRANSNLLQGQNQTTLVSQQLSEISSELSRVRANRASAEATASAVRQVIDSGGSVDALPSVLASPLIERLRERHVDLNAQIADARTTLLEGHPRLKSLRSQLADLQGQIASEARKLLTSLSTQTNAARLREQQLTAELNRMKAETAQADEQTVELRALEREAAAERQLLETYLGRFREASLRNESEYVPADARIFSQAVRPTEAYFPKPVPITIAAFVAGLMLGVLGTLLSELFSGRALRGMPVAGDAEAETAVQNETPKDAVAKPGLFARKARPSILAPELAPEMVPEVDKAPDNAFHHAATVADDLIASGVEQVTFLSPEGEGGIAGSIRIAREMADQGVRTLLVDLTSSGAAGLAMLETTKVEGITNVLSGKGTLEKAIHVDLYSDVHIIPKGTGSVALAMRNASQLPGIITAAASAYEIVLVECGPADLGDLGLVLAEVEAGAIVISCEQVTAEIRELGQALEAEFDMDVSFVTTAAERKQRRPRGARQAA